MNEKNIVIGVCGGIAAYKVVDVVSRLKKLNANVHVIMTENAQKFVTPLTFRSISRNPVVADMFAPPEAWDIQHISLAEKADLMVVAPATANILGKAANGIADDMLSTTLMATHAPVLFVPAMNSSMYGNPIVQKNIKELAGHGYSFMEPETGLLACGASGKGRLPGPEAIVDHILKMLTSSMDMKGLKLLITAGPTVEPIDPVRFISNRSSGKMGFAIAGKALERGAEVILVSGPAHIKKPAGAKVIEVRTAEEMYNSVMDNYHGCHIIIMMAAVADYRCENISGSKIKKTGTKMLIELVKNRDIAKELGKVKGHRVLAGACAETENLLDNAMEKMKLKNFDVIMANDVTMEGAGFQADTNIVKIIKKDGGIIELPLMSKNAVADVMLDTIMSLSAVSRTGQ